MAARQPIELTGDGALLGVEIGNVAQKKSSRPLSGLFTADTFTASAMPSANWGRLGTAWWEARVVTNRRTSRPLSASIEPSAAAGSGELKWLISRIRLRGWFLRWRTELLRSLGLITAPFTSGSSTPRPPFPGAADSPRGGRQRPVEECRRCWQRGLPVVACRAGSRTQHRPRAICRVTISLITRPCLPTPAGSRAHRHGSRHSPEHRNPVVSPNGKPGEKMDSGPPYGNNKFRGSMASRFVISSGK